MNKKNALRVLSFILYFHLVVCAMGVLVIGVLPILVLKFSDLYSWIDVLAVVSVSASSLFLCFVTWRVIHIKNNMLSKGIIEGLLCEDSLNKLIKLMWLVFIASIGLFIAEEFAPQSALLAKLAEPITRDGFKLSMNFQSMSVFTLNLGGINGLLIISFLSLVKSLAKESFVLKQETEGLV